MPKTQETGGWQKTTHLDLRALASAVSGAVGRRKSKSMGGVAISAILTRLKPLTPPIVPRPQAYTANSEGLNDKSKTQAWTTVAKRKAPTAIERRTRSR